MSLKIAQFGLILYSGNTRQREVAYNAVEEVWKFNIPTLYHVQDTKVYFQVESVLFFCSFSFTSSRLELFKRSFSAHGRVAKSLSLLNTNPLSHSGLKIPFEILILSSRLMKVYHFHCIILFNKNSSILALSCLVSLGKVSFHRNSII
jgi:hypothetical protein